MFLSFVAAAAATTVGIWSGASGAVSYDLQLKLMTSGQFAAVDVHDLNSEAPTLSTLEAYDVVWVFSTSPYHDPDDLGDALADYMDAGGGVVVAPYLLTADLLDGRFADEGYAPFVAAEGTQMSGGYAWLVADDANHPILAGVTAANAGSGSNVQGVPGVASGATLVAHWDSGGAAVGVRETPGRCAFVTLVPASSDAYETYYDVETDVPQLLVNVTAWAAGDIGAPGDTGDTGATDTGDDGGDSGGTGDCFDCDGDGYDDSVDCNDLSSAVHPGADEVEDGLDNDCDGAVDAAGADGKAAGCGCASSGLGGASGAGGTLPGLVGLVGLALVAGLRRRGGRAAS